MKLKFNVAGKYQPDPFIFEDEDRLYLYVTGKDGVEAYSADELFGEWAYQGVVAAIEGHREFWAPSVIKIDGRYYMYVSSSTDTEFEYMRAAVSDSPLGPFGEWRTLYNRFSIDSHAVMTESGLYLWYAEDNLQTDRIGTRVFVDKMIDPFTPQNTPKEVIVPTFDEEIFMRNRYGDGKDWHTVEGAFWFKEGEWQYLMYSGGCFENGTYHIGYASVKSDADDFLELDFEKYAPDGKFTPIITENSFEEGTGHNSVIKYKGNYYAVYHGRDIGAIKEGYSEQRTARVCKLKVSNGIITAERYEDRL